MTSIKIKITKVCDYVILFSLYIIIFFFPVSKAIIESFSILAIVAYVIKKFVNFDDLPRSPLNFGIFAYLTVCVFSIFISSNSAISFRTFFAKTLQDIFFFFVVFEALNEKKQISNLLNAFFLSSLVLGIDGIYQHFTTMDFLRHRPFMDSERIFASFATPNAFGCYLAMVIPFLISRFFLKFRFKVYRFMYFALFCLLFICLLFTASRGAWLAFLSLVLFMSIWLNGLTFFSVILGIAIWITHIFYPPFIKNKLIDFFVFSDTKIGRASC